MPAQDQHGLADAEAREVDDRVGGDRRVAGHHEDAVGAERALLERHAQRLGVERVVAERVRLIERPADVQRLVKAAVWQALGPRGEHLAQQGGARMPSVAG